MTLYELTKLDNDQFADGLATRLIRPNMARKDIAELLRKPKGEEHSLTIVPRAGRFYLIQAAVDALDEVDDASVDAIITDPPYPREYLPVYGQRRVPGLARRGVRLERGHDRAFHAGRPAESPHSANCGIPD